MDLSLPDIDGLEVTRLLRQNPNFHHVPIIAISAHAMSSFQESSLEARLNDFITKPFLPNDLINIVRKHI